MEPAIGRSIKEGFRATNRSWAALGLVVGSWVVVWVVAGLMVVLTQVPAELFRPPAALQQTAAPDAGTPGAPAAPEDDQAQAVRETEENRLRIAGEWFGRAWPMLLVALLFLSGISTWLYGGQIGYLAKQVRGEPTKISEFWIAGTRAFWPLLGGWLISLLLAVGIVAAIVLVALAIAALPDAVSGILGVILTIAGVVALVWLLVRAVLWFVAIVADRLGPIAGLTASFRATRGRWWKLFGLLLLLLLIALGVGLVFALFEGLGDLLGGVSAVAIRFLSSVLQLVVVNLYLGFAMTAALIRFYEDTKSVAATGGSGAP